MHNKLYKIVGYSCGGGAYKKCVVYDPNTSPDKFNVYNNNFFFGNHVIAPTMTINYDLLFNNGII